MSSRQRTALVTGASRGIGRGVAEGLAALGWSVTVTARDGEPLAALADVASQPGVDILTVTGDLAEGGGPAARRRGAPRPVHHDGPRGLRRVQGRAHLVAAVVEPGGVQVGGVRLRDLAGLRRHRHERLDPGPDTGRGDDPVSDVVHTVLSVIGLSARTVLPEIVMTRAGRHQYDA